jgi:hypothetical protein
MLRTKNATTTAAGMAAGVVETNGSAKPDRTVSATNAANHGTAWRAL